MSKKTLITLILPLLSLLAISLATPLWGVPAHSQRAAKTMQSAVATASGGIFRKDDRGKRKRHDGSRSHGVEPRRLCGLPGGKTHYPEFRCRGQFLLPILVFNDLLRGIEPGSMNLIPAGFNPLEAAVPAAPKSLSQATRQPLQNLPVALGASLYRLVIEKLPSGQEFDLAVRDANTGFTFFNVQEHQYDYDPAAKSLSITGGRLLISREFANAMGQPSDAGCGSRNNLCRRGDAADRDHTGCEWSASVAGDAICATCSRSRSPEPCARPGCYRWKYPECGTARERRDTGWFSDRNRLL